MSVSTGKRVLLETYRILSELQKNKVIPDNTKLLEKTVKQPFLCLNNALFSSNTVLQARSEYDKIDHTYRGSKISSALSDLKVALQRTSPGLHGEDFTKSIISLIEEGDFTHLSTIIEFDANSTDPITKLEAQKGINAIKLLKKLPYSFRKKIIEFIKKESVCHSNTGQIECDFIRNIELSLQNDYLESIKEDSNRIFFYKLFKDCFELKYITQIISSSIETSFTKQRNPQDPEMSAKLDLAISIVICIIALSALIYCLHFNLFVATTLKAELTLWELLIDLILKETNPFKKLLDINSAFKCLNKGDFLKNLQSINDLYNKFDVVNGLIALSSVLEITSRLSSITDLIDIFKSGFEKSNKLDDTVLELKKISFEIKMTYRKELGNAVFDKKTRNQSFAVLTASVLHENLENIFKLWNRIQNDQAQIASEEMRQQLLTMLNRSQLTPEKAEIVADAVPQLKKSHRIIEYNIFLHIHAIKSTLEELINRAIITIVFYCGFYLREGYEFAKDKAGSFVEYCGLSNRTGEEIHIR